MPLRRRVGWLVVVLLAALPTAAQAAPTCAEGPETVGSTIVGTPCADTIHAPRGITVVQGEGGDDVLFGGRGNEQLLGGEGADRLYGGIGDDRLRGGPGDDRLSGGFGADSLDGQGGGDFARGDATIDAIDESGADAGIDTLSYATGATPGFVNQGPFFDYEGFPGAENGRGVYIDLEDDAATDGNGFANNGRAPVGGGVDLDLDGENFERVIGTPFPDFIVGSADGEAIYGGGGADVLRGEGGIDQVLGGDEGDSCSAAAGSTVDCERGDAKVEPRSPGSVASGLMAPAGIGPPALYLTGSTGSDVGTAAYSPSPPTVSFTVNGSPAGSFVLAEVPDSVLLAGLGGNDTLTAAGFPETTSVVLLGGEGEDELEGGATEDAAVDGPGNDDVAAAGGDDAVPNNGGDDDLDAGPGDDLFVSDAVCNGDRLDGGPGRDNANWANFEQAVTIDLEAQAAGLVGPAGGAQCPSPALLTELAGLEDTEGTRLADVMVGDDFDNQLLGRLGADSYFAAAGNDSILANSGTPTDDPDPTIDCGPGFDTALVDRPENGPDAAPVECESVEARNPNSFRPPDTPPDPEPEPEPPVEEDGPTNPPPPPPEPPQGDDDPDRTAPRTALARRPARLLFALGLRRVAFAFRSNEAGTSFRCRIDRRPFRPCRSPRAHRVGPGRHVFRVFAIDAAGNRDRTPAVFSFRLRR